MSPSASPIEWSPSPSLELRNRPQLSYFLAAPTPTIETQPKPQNPPNAVAQRRGGTSNRGARAGRGTRVARGSMRSRGQKAVLVSTKDQEQYDSPSENEMEDLPKKKVKQEV